MTIENNAIKKPNKILVTGAAGFIGYHLVKKLVQTENEIIGLDIINDYYDLRVKYGRLEDCDIHLQNIKHNVLVQSTNYSDYRFIKLDLSDQKHIYKLFESEKFDVVVNLAAQAGVRYSITNPDAYLNSNIIGFYNILEACRHNKVEHLVFASSSSVYGWNEKLPFSTSDNVDHPISLYAASKKSNELLAHSYSALYDIPTTGLRFFTVYGPWGRPDMALFLFAKNIIEGKPIDVYNHGKMIRDFTYVDDIVEGIQRVIQNPPQGNPQWDGKNPDPGSSKAPYKIYNIGNDDPVQLLDFIEAIEHKLGKKAIKNMLPLQVGDVPASHADVTDLIADLGYKPNTPIQEGVNKFIDWYLEFYGKQQTVDGKLQVEGRNRREEKKWEQRVLKKLKLGNWLINLYLKYMSWQSNFQEMKFMAIGKPVIASENGGNGEIIKNDDTGFIICPKSSIELTEKIINLLDNKSLKMRMNRNSRERIKNTIGGVF